jgi:Tfp pilus assembly protein PilO
MSFFSKLETSPRTLAIAVVGLLLVVTAATWFVLVSPKRNQANSLSSQIQVAQATLNERQITARHAVSKIDQALYIDRALPDTEAIPQVILQLSRIATSDHVSLNAVTPAALAAYSGFNAIPITIIVGGRFFDIEAFLHDLRTQVSTNPQGAISSTGRLFDVQSVTLSTSATPPILSATLALDVFDYSGTPLGGTPTSGAST